MPTIKRCLVLPAAIVAMIAMSSAAAAQCDSNAYGASSAGASAGACGGSCGQTGGCAGGCSNGSRWPSGGCADGNCGSGVGSTGSLFGLREGFDKYKADFALNNARNQAWPLPFACWDREAYNQVFAVSYQNGLQTAQMLTSQHFNPETNKLNRAGENVVAWIMQKAIQSNKQVFIYEDITGPTMDQRLASVSGFANRYYAHMGTLQVAKSSIKPNEIPADYVARSMESYFQETPSQRIPVQVGASLNSSVGN